MNKIIYQDSNEELLQSLKANGESLVTLLDTENGVKRAASDMISKETIEKYRPTDSKTAAIHLIAMGDYENYGYNRNGDAFPAKALEKYAHTFVTNGHMFREHRNKDPKKAIGTIKYAAYDPNGMHRVELIVHMDKDKAEEEFEMAKRGSDLNFSMSCKVPNDRCSICGNEAKTISGYCDHLKHHMGQYDDGMKKYAFAYNDKPTFFDISRVVNPADRIARHLGYYFEDPKNDIEKAASVMCKAASADEDVLVPGAVAALAEGLHDGFSIAEQNLIQKMAAAEDYILNSGSESNIYKDAHANDMFATFPYSMMSRFDKEELDAVRAVKPETLFHEMSKRACMMSFPAFCQYITGEENITEAPMFKKAALMLPGTFTRIVRKVYTMVPCTDAFAAGSEFASECDPKRDDLVQKVMDKAEDKFSVKDEPSRKRVLRIIIKAGSVNRDGAFEKAAAAKCDTQKAMDLSEAYGQYQLRSLVDMKDMHGDAINDNTYDMVVSANSACLFDIC